MAKQIIWAEKAIEDKIEIFEFWNRKNKSTSYSKKLNNLFDNAAKLLAVYPSIGQKSSRPFIRVKTVKEYLIVYEVTPELIMILRIWPGKKNPIEFDRIF